MDVGIYMDLRNPASWRKPWADHYASQLELVEEAERLGAHSVWLSEHHFFDDGYLPQPLTFAAAIAARTKTVRIGTAVFVVPFRSAVQIAEEVAIVDLVSGGRFDLGVGAGYRGPEFSAFGADPRRRYEVTEDRLREVLRLWAENAVTPPPIQQPVPIWGGFSGPRGARMTGRLGLGLIAPGMLTSEAALFTPYREGLIAGGHSPDSARLKGVSWIILADDPEAAWARIKPHFSYLWDSYNRYSVEGTAVPPPPPINPEQWRVSDAQGRPPRFQVLTPSGAAQVIRERMEGLPVEEVFLWSSIAGMPIDLVERHIQLVCTDLRVLLAEEVSR